MIEYTDNKSPRDITVMGYNDLGIYTDDDKEKDILIEKARNNEIDLVVLEMGTEIYQLFIKVECVGCGYKANISENRERQFDYGFEYLWDTSQGLNNIVMCEECSKDVRESINTIERITKVEINDINFEGFNK